MHVTEPIGDNNLSEILICPQCSASMPSYSEFCGSCGAQLNEARKADVVGMKLIGDEAREYVLVSKKISAVTRPAAAEWGWLPVLSLTCAVGVFILALAAEAGRLASHWADPLFWLGLLVLFVPVAARIISPKPARRERIALLVMLGSALYLLRFLEQPLSFGFNDEFLQWRTALNIAASGHLFLPSPLLPISPFYPGLQIVTDAVSSLTGLSIFLSGMIVLRVAGIVIVLGLYLFYEYISGSAQIAGIAVLLYMAKPTFFADTLYHYEDLAMPLMAFVLFALVRRSYTPKGRRFGLTLAIWLGLAAVVVTHHATSYVLDSFLILWTVVFLVLRTNARFHKNRDRKALVGPGWAALLAIALGAAWLAYTGGLAIGYLYPTVQTTVYQFLRILSGQQETRQFFSNAGGFVEPIWERLTAFAAVGLISLGLPFGLIQIWRHYRANPAIIALAIGVLAYPVILIIRLTQAGVNLGGRAEPYVFGSVALVLAIGITRFWLSHAPNWRSRTLLTGVIAVIFIGGWVTGTSPIWDRLPGPYLAYGDQRSIQPESVTAAEWAGSHLGPGQRIIGDQYNTILMGTYGNEWVVTTANDKIFVASVFTSPQIDSNVAATLKQGNVQFIVVDSRLIGVEQTGYPQPDTQASLAKFDGAQNVSRVFDSGDIAIYNVEAITSGASTTPTPPPVSLCKPASSTGVSGSYPTINKFFTGTFFDIPQNQSSPISLTGIQQQPGNFCGNFSGKQVNGSFNGTITTNRDLQFIITSQTAQDTYTFDGSLTPDGIIVGTFCGSAPGTTQCNDYGLWSAAPAQSG